MARRMTKTEHLRSLITRQIRSMEKRGFRVADEIKNKIKTAKYQTLNALHDKKYKKLYQQATAEINGKIVTGTKKRNVQRTESAIKGAETRKLNQHLNKRARELGYADFSDMEKAMNDEKAFIQRRKAQDMIDRKKAINFEEGSVMYDRIKNLIDEYPTPGSKMLNKALSSEIAKYGKNDVLRAMGNVGESIISFVQSIVYYEESADAIHSALVELFQIITGTILSTDEAKEIGNVMDEMTSM